MKKALPLALLALGIVLVGCSTGTEEETDVPADESTQVGTSSDELTYYKKFTQRYLCTTTPTEPNLYCQRKGYDGGSIHSTSSCFRVDDFSVKDVVYNCRVRT